MKIHIHSRLVLLSIVLSICTIAVYGQTIEANLKKLHTEFKEEKIYMHFDREVYFPKDTVWFKAYLFSGNYPSLISTVFYVDMVDQTGKIIEHKMLPVVQSGASGFMKLPENLSGEVFIRGYTRWMLNFDSTQLYTKSIDIYNGPDGSTQASNKTSGAEGGAKSIGEMKIQFLPEGGDLVNTVSSKLAFKATDMFGVPVVVEGKVVNSKGDSITVFKTMHDGMGFCMITPVEGETYKAVFVRDKMTKEYALPAAKEKGVVLQVRNDEKFVYFNIRISEKNTGIPAVNLIAHINQQLIYRAKIPINDQLLVSGRIPVSGLPAGVVHLTVFDPENHPLAERLVFINLKESSFKVNLNTGTFNPGSRKKNIIELEVPDTIPANLSVSVTAAGLPRNSAAPDIFSAILLNADIRGEVFNPGFYFSGNDSAGSYLDLVMLTHGWRRFKWEAVNRGEFPEIRYWPENYLSFMGKIKTGVMKKEGMEELMLILQPGSSPMQYLKSPVGKEGNFNFANLIFYDSARVFLKWNRKGKLYNLKKPEADMDADVLMKGIALAVQTGRQKKEGLSDEKLRETYTKIMKAVSNNEMMRTKELQEVIVSGKVLSKQAQVNKEYTSGAFGDEGRSKIILPEDDPAFLSSINVLQYLQSRVSGLQVDPNVDENAISWRGQPTAIFIDEITQQTPSQSGAGEQTVEDARFLKSIPMSEIAMVKVFPPPFMGAWGNGAGGAVAVYLKKRNSSGKGDNEFFATVRGFSAPRQFYSPDYDNDSSDSFTDARATIYWNPEILTNKNIRKIVLPFYTSDISTGLRIVMEGMNEDGKLIRIERIL